MRDPVSAATNFHDLSRGIGLCRQWRSHANALVLDAVSSRDNGLKNIMAATLEAEYAFDAEDLGSRPKVVKFAVIHRHEEQGAADQLASFEAVMLPHMDAAHNLARWLMRDERDAHPQVLVDAVDDDEPRPPTRRQLAVVQRGVADKVFAL